MGPYGHLYHPAAIAGLDDIDPAPEGMNTHPKSFEGRRPRQHLALLAGQCIDGRLVILATGLYPLAIGVRHLIGT